MLLIIEKLLKFKAFKKALYVNLTSLKNTAKKNKSILIKNTIKDLDINPDNCVYIGDTEGDFIASNNNGIKFIYAGWGYGEYVEQAHLHLNDIRELI